MTSNRLLRRASGAMIDQVVTAGGSFVLQLIAARKLGLTGYGAFALCLSILTSITALYTGSIGDALTVMNRYEERIRRALAACALGLLVLCTLVAGLLVPVLGLGGLSVSAAYAVMVAAWLVEETGRRVLMARLQFWQLVTNDVVYTLVTLIALGAGVISGHRLSLLLVLVSMAIGAAASIVAARVQLPAEEYRRTRLSWAGVRDIVDFSLWRSLQTSLAPAQLLVARLIVLRLGSLAAVGAVEAGRLALAPLQSLINGAGGLLLSTAAEAERNPTSANRRLSERAAAVLAGATALGGCCAAVFAGPLGRLLVGTRLSWVLVLGWTIYLVRFSLALPFASELVARKLTRQVFAIRSADWVVSVAALVIGLLSGLSATWTPLLLSVGGPISVILMRRLAVRTRVDSQPGPAGTSPALGPRDDATSPTAPVAPAASP